MSLPPLTVASAPKPRRRVRALASEVNDSAMPMTISPAIDAATRDAVNAFTTAMMLHESMVTDAFTNQPARTGFGTSNLLEATEYPLTRLSRNYILMQSLYRSNWIARKVVDCVAEDMMKHWVRFDSDLDPKKIKKFDRAIRTTATRTKLTDAIKWARLFGGAGAVMMIAGDEGRLDKPLDPDDVGPGEYRGLLVFDRWSGISPGATMIYDLDNPVEFDLPETYLVTTEGGQSLTVHHSRVLRFCGRGLPHWEWQAEQRWGISEYEVIFEELKKRDNTSANIASLVFRANILALRQKDLSQLLTGLGASPQAQKNFNASLQAQVTLMSNQGLMILPEEGGLEQHTYAFSGISEVYHEFMLDICGAAEIPMSRLFGRSASGLAGTNEGDEHAYYDTIAQKQSRDLDGPLDKLFPIIAMSEWGKVPDDFDYSYNSARSMSAEEKGNLAAIKSTPIFESFNSGIIGRKTALQEMQGLTDETGMFSNIDQDTIDEADDTPITEMQMNQEMALAGAGGEDGEEGEGPGGGQGSNSLTGAPGAKAKGNKPNPKAKGKAAKSDAKGKDKGKKKPSKAKGKKKSGKAKDEATVPVALEETDPTVEFGGLLVWVENPVGSTRSGTSPDGDWSVTMTHPYGFIQRSLGVDGDEVDCFLGPNESADKVYIVHTQSPGSDPDADGEHTYDEDKVMLGFDSTGDAMAAFFDNYSSPDHFQSVETIHLADFPRKLEHLRGRKLVAH